MKDFELVFEASPEGRADAKAAFHLFDKKDGNKVMQEEVHAHPRGLCVPTM